MPVSLFAVAARILVAALRADLAYCQQIGEARCRIRYQVADRIIRLPGQRR